MQRPPRLCTRWHTFALDAADPGYLSQPQGWSSDLLYGSSFEQGYPDVCEWASGQLRKLPAAISTR